MVLNNKTALKHLKHITSPDLHDYLVYKGSHFNYLHNKACFAQAINVLEFINLVIWANTLYKNLGTNKCIPICIFYTTLEALLEERPFTKKESKAFNKAVHQVEGFKDHIANFYNIDFFSINTIITDKLNIKLKPL